VFVDDAAADLLGWDPAELTGRRVTAIVPPGLREAHVAGFARYQISRSPVLLGRTVRVPAQHRDGREVPVQLTIEAYHGGDGLRGFRAVLAPDPAGGADGPPV
jgi:PAS domain S-box-containing protein